jgi:hypothetical protein
MTELIYYKKNVKYVIGGRFFVGDPQGWTLTDANPFIGVKPDNLRDFKMANKRAIIEGLIVLAQEPSIDWETNNAITDEEGKELVKNYMLLKQTLEKIDSFQTANKLLEIAKELDRPTKTIKLIESRVAELDDNEDELNFNKEGVE